MINYRMLYFVHGNQELVIHLGPQIELAYTELPLGILTKMKNIVQLLHYVVTF